MALVAEGRPPKDWPVLFGADMVLAVRANRKTQTRRRGPRWLNAHPGDLMWTRESWSVDRALDLVPPHMLSRDVEVEYLCDGARRNNRDSFVLGRERSGIYLPRWASRDLLVIREVRRQRVQDITDEDADAEGICALEGQVRDEVLCAKANVMGAMATDSRVWFAVLWDRIHGAGAWDVNAQVTAITFERTQPLKRKEPT